MQRMNERVVLLSMLTGLWVTGCADEVAPEPPLEFCQGAVSFAWDPVNRSRLEAFPDDTYTRVDATTPTGLRLHVTQETAPWLAEQASPAVAAYDALNALDGWGTSSALFLRFDGAVSAPPSGPDTASDLSLMLLASGPQGWTPVDYEAWRVDETQTLMVRPIRPLSPKTSHALIVTRSFEDSDGGCIAPGEALESVLRGDEGDGRLLDALKSVGLAADQVSAATVFTTQSVVEVSLAVSKDIANRGYTWSAPPSCVAEEHARRCEGRFVAQDYRTDGVVLSPEAVAPWELDVSVWLPLEAPGPYPVLIFGHGLNDRRDKAASLMERFGDLNFAVVAIDALHHGTHPTAGDGGGVLAFFDFFAIDAESVSIKPLELRDNLRQSNYDRLQLLELLESNPDIDGDGAEDLDMDRLGYVGTSLGAIMGSELLALSGRFDLTILEVGGARFTSIVENGADYEVLYLVFEEVLGAPDETVRMLPVIQAAVDAGDPVNYAPHVLRDRIDIRQGSPPHLWMNAALGDTTVAHQSAHCLARALQCPIVSEDRFGEGSLSVAEAPLQGNLDSGAVTAGFTQMDRVTVSDGQVVLADHDNGSSCAETLSAERHFLTTWLTQDLPEIRDPYVTLGTPALEL
jgi:hypothetical protein